MTVAWIHNDTRLKEDDEMMFLNKQMVVFISEADEEKEDSYVFEIRRLGNIDNLLYSH